MGSDTLQPLWDNRALLLALGVAVYALARCLRWARQAWLDFKAWLGALIDERVPSAVKSSLSNGGGDIIRRIIFEENARQMEAWHAAPRRRAPARRKTKR